MKIDISSQVSNHQLTIRIAGHFTFLAHGEFRKSFQGLLNEQIAEVTLDFAGLDYIDSSALGLLLTLRAAAEKLPRKIRIINSPPKVKGILKIANFERLFDIA
ncbi:STAS domain-containing protein [Dechloromonas sp. ZY10]|uniref:STAS domain-containing protein n=1 Tax=Dechloromonas aquae TaxID=2664436 RepID=UPI0035284D45